MISLRKIINYETGKCIEAFKANFLISLFRWMALEIEVNMVP